MKFTLCLLTCLALTFKLLGQDLAKAWYVEKVTNLQDQVLKIESYEVKKIFDKIGANNLNNEVYVETILESLINVLTGHKASLDAAESFNTHSKILNLDLNINRDELETLASNFELFELISIGVLNPESPFELDIESPFLEEIKFYGINENDKIGEIGGGTGTFIILTSILYPEVDLVINELGEQKVKFISNRINQYKNQLATKRIQVIKGEIHETNFEKEVFDKIIIRNTFHHFKKKKQMLSSILKSLNSNGELFLYEPFLGLQENQQQCNKVMNLDKAIKIIEKAGFVLVEKNQIDSRMLIRFKPK